MQIGYFNGAMYVKPNDEEIRREPVQLAGTQLFPGEFVKQVGEKKRSRFVMQDGFILRYEGKINNILLFSVNQSKYDYYYAFFYIDETTLLCCNESGCWDVRVSQIEKVYPQFMETYEQLSLELR